MKSIAIAALKIAVLIFITAALWPVVTSKFGINEETSILLGMLLGSASASVGFLLFVDK